MARPNVVIRQFILALAILLLGVVGVAGQLALADDVNINVEICTGANAEPTLSLNYESNVTTFYSPITLNFSGAWLYTLSTEGNGGTMLGSSTLIFADNQTFSQTINLIEGINNLTLKYNGGCPKHNLTRNVVFNYLPNGLSVNHIITNSGSPTLTGNVGKNNRKIKITINGQVYDAINNNDGTWVLSAGTISPVLTDGDYDVTMQLIDENGGAVLNNVVENDAVSVRGGAPSVTVNPVVTNNSSPMLSGTISSSAHKVQVLINGRVYNAVNNGDGTWTLAAGTISPALVDGRYNIIVNAIDPATNIIVANHALTPGITIDTHAPNLTIDTAETTERQPEINGTVDDPTANIEVLINGRVYNAINNGDGTWTLVAGVIAPLASGEYDVVVKALDGAGNITTKNIVFKVNAPNELGFVLPPHTGYLRINRVNVPSWLLYLLVFSLVFFIIKRRRRERAK